MADCKIGGETIESGTTLAYVPCKIVTNDIFQNVVVWGLIIVVGIMVLGALGMLWEKLTGEFKQTDPQDDESAG